MSKKLFGGGKKKAAEPAAAPVGPIVKAINPDRARDLIGERRRIGTKRGMIDTIIGSNLTLGG